MNADEDEKRRKSRPKKAALETDPRAVARLEAENGLRQFDFVVKEIDAAISSDKPFVLRPSFIQALNRLAIEGISELPGVYRPGEMEITNSSHVPPAASKVALYVEELCDYVNGNWSKSPWHLAAYSMWRLNWVHPFEDGNGRTSRALSYFILCVRLKQKLPGKKTIPDFIADNKKPYYDALEEGDRAAETGKIDLRAMEDVLKGTLAAQLAEYHQDVTGYRPNNPGLLATTKVTRAKNAGPRRDSFLQRLYHKYPFWFWLAGLGIPILLTIIFS